jgi:hypothetical protein
MRTKILALGSTLLLVAGLITLGAASAEAHTPNVSADCSSLSVSLKDYNSKHHNTVSVTIDGTVVDSDSDFGKSFVEEYSFSPNTVAHTWEVEYTAWDDPDGSAGWTGSQSGTTTPCVSHDNHKVTLCHYNHGVNPWGPKPITVDWDSVVKSSGHDSHANDIIPAFDYWVKHDGQWTQHHYDGKNLTTVWSGATGAEILANGCSIPDAKDAAAEVHTTDATCSTAQTLVLGTITNATWGTPTRTTGPGSYSVTATAVDGHRFADGSKTKVFTGTLSGVLSSTSPTCAPPCLPNSSVSYTYSPTTNSGIITVTAKAGFSDKLCSPFWVTAASWTFDGNTMWPQTLDKWNPANSGNKIDSVGTYPYGADVGCGQGDIYATFNAPGVPYPTAGILNGPNNPYLEHFLHDMGFSGPNPTYTVRDAASCNAVTAAVVFQGYTCNDFGPLVLTGSHVTFTVKYDDATPVTSVSGVAPGSYELLADFAAQTGDRYFGQVTVTVQADPGFSLLSVGTPVPLTANTKVPAIVKADPTMQTTWVLDANLPQDCPTVITVVPAVTFTDDCGTVDDAIVGATDTDAIDYTITDNRIDGVGLVSVSAAPKTGYVFADGAYTAPWTHTFTSEPCAVTFGDPYAVDEVCSETQEGATVSGYIWVDFGGNLANEVEYTITGTGSTTYPATVATSEVTPLAPGTYMVTVVAKPGYVLQGEASWGPFTIAAAGTCTLITHPLISTTASSKNLTCTSAGSYTLADTEGVLWFVDGSTTPTAPGTYSVTTASTVNVEAQLTGPDYGWEDGAQTTWSFDFTLPVDCIPTLAYTGTNGGTLGLLLAGGLLLFGGAVIAFERRFRTGARQ